MTREELYRIFGGWLSLPTPEALDIVLAVVLANRCSTDPLWMFLVAPPSSAKTELLRALGDVSDTYPLSNLTASTFASGFQNPSKTSLLPKITGKLLVLKDFTTV